jgi:hypothetical protein
MAILTQNKYFFLQNNNITIPFQRQNCDRSNGIGNIPDEEFNLDKKIRISTD